MRWFPKSIKEKTKLSIVAGFVVFGMKLLIGIFSSSVFLISSAIFTLALALSKSVCLIGLEQDQDEEQTRYLILSSLLIVLAGFSYAGYNVRLFFGVKPQDFGLIPAIAIAGVSFFLFVRSIVALIRSRGRSIYEKNLKIISFFSALADIMLTQMSLLIVELPQMDQIYNAYLAFAIGLATAITGLWAMRKRF